MAVSVGGCNGTGCGLGMTKIPWRAINPSISLIMAMVVAVIGLDASV
jgi:hypothetical protein